MDKVNMEGPGQRDDDEVSGRCRDSDEVFELFCQPCNDEGDNHKAEGFCHQCNQFLCKTCIKFHKRNKMTKAHDILDEQSMPSSMEMLNESNTDCNEYCKVHPTERIRYYCTVHNDFGCGDCMIPNYSSCKPKLIAEVSNDFIKGQDLKDLKQEIQNIESNCSEMGEHMNKSVQIAEDDIVEAMKTLQKLKAEIISHLDTEEKRLKSELESLKSGSGLAIQEASKVIRELKSLSSDMLDKIDSEKQSPSQIFKASKQMQEKISTSIKYKFAEVVNQCRIRIAFYPNSIFNDLMSNKQPLGKVDVMPTKIGVALEECNFAKSDSINIRTSKDSQTCAVTGCVMISDRKLLVVDSRNNAVKLIDIVQQRILSYLYVHKNIWDITALPDDEAAVTNRSKKTIEIMSYKQDTLSVVRSISVKGKCVGIDDRNSQLVVSFVDPSEIEIMDMTGNVLNRMLGEDLQAISIERPQYVVFSKLDDGIMISDWPRNTVTALDLKLKHMWSYSDKDLKRPYSLLITQDGNILVSGYDSNNIHLLSNNGKKIKVLLKKEDGITHPFATALYGSTLLVAGHENDLKLYKITN